jgi:flagellar hook-associated protein 2
MRELTTANIRTTVTKNASLADVGVSTNLDGTLKLDQNKLASAMVSNPGMLESLIFSKKIGDDEVDGALKKMLDMTDVIMAPTSSFNEIAKRTQQVDLPKIETEVTKLDDAMTALQAKYLKQFSAMQSAVLSAKSTQDSLTQSMSAWTAGLK